MRDPKFGYHWIWILPVLRCVMLFDAVHAGLAAVIGRARGRYREWKHPDIRRLRVLSGIDEKKGAKDG